MFNTAHLHPMIVHFPIALIMVGFLADLLYLFNKKEICLSKTGLYLMVLGTLAAGAAFLTGNLFTVEPRQGAIVDVFEKHETFALITLLIMAIGSTIRIYTVIKKPDSTILRWTVFCFYLAGTLTVGLTGFLGGSMVFDYMVGI